MKFSIITPTIQRESLVKCCESVSTQNWIEWEHLIVVDSQDFNGSLFHRIPYDPRRELWKCSIPHNNFGNTCRHQAWEKTTGDYILYLDDDNWLADPDVLKDIAAKLSEMVGMWALFPILRHGSRFFHDPPRCCFVDTANAVVSRKIGRWPDRNEYTLDGIWVEELVSKYPYQAFPDFRPIVVMPKSSEGK